MPVGMVVRIVLCGRRGRIRRVYFVVAVIPVVFGGLLVGHVLFFLVIDYRVVVSVVVIIL